MTKVKKFASAFLVVGLSSVLLNSALSNTDKPIEFKEQEVSRIAEYRNAIDDTFIKEFGSPITRTIQQYRKDQLVQVINENLEFSKTHFTIDDGFGYSKENNDIVNKNIALAEKAGVFDDESLFNHELNKIKNNGPWDYKNDLRDENYMNPSNPNHAFYLDKPLDFKEPKHDKSLVSQRISQLNEKIYNNSNDTSLKNKNKI